MNAIGSITLLETIREKSEENFSGFKFQTETPISKEERLLY
jgi:hypothetical protein